VAMTASRLGAGYRPPVNVCLPLPSHASQLTGPPT
jgi:hypothetical protein